MPFPLWYRAVNVSSRLSQKFSCYMSHPPMCSLICLWFLIQFWLAPISFPFPICFQMHQLHKDICTSFYDSTTCFHLRQEIYSWIQQPLWGSGVEMVSHELQSQENDFGFIWNAAYFSIVLVVFLGHSGLSLGTAELLDLSYCI